MKKFIIYLSALMFLVPVLSAAEPPSLLNYQGVLRDASDTPLDGGYDMAFRFYDAETVGNEILIDQHLASGTGAVTATDGMFNAQLGGGSVSDGSGPGTYTSLTQVFRDYATVYLEVGVYNTDTSSWETLSPRIRMLSSAYALNSDYLEGVESSQLLRSDTSDQFTSGTMTFNGGTILDVDGSLQIDGTVSKATTDLVMNLNADYLDGYHSTAFAASVHTHPGSDITSGVSSANNADMVDGYHASYFLNTSATEQTKSGGVNFNAQSNAYYAVQGHADGAGAYFSDSNNSGYAYIGEGEYGIRAWGNLTGGYFRDADSSGFAYVGDGDYGIWASGNYTGGYFADLDNSAYAYISRGDYGIQGYGNTAGGYFQDTNSTGSAYVGYADYGIYAYGSWIGGHFHDTDQSGEANIGAGDIGIASYGDEMGGHFEDTNSSGMANIASADRGIVAYGNEAGGFFQDINSTGYAFTGYGDTGVYARGNSYGIDAGGSGAGGYFTNYNMQSSAYICNTNYGIDARGPTAGGYFADFNGTGKAIAGYGDLGIHAEGNTAGGYFIDLNNNSYTYVAYGNYGIDARGPTGGGYFADTNSSGYAYIAPGDRGVDAQGNEMGAYFKDRDSSGYARVGYGDRGIEAFGNVSGGYFKDANNTGASYVGDGDYGIRSYGSLMGGYFEDTDSTCYAYVGNSDFGIRAFGNYAGGFFEDLDTLTWSETAFSTYKIYGTGTVSFVQNHPNIKDQVIVYAAPEGDEVATYTRGTARLINGEAHIQLGETFKWVTNPDIGLTVYLTPVGDWSDLYVAEKSTNEVVVRSKSATQDVVFDYIVYGLRIGFEEISIIQEKQRESWIPSMKDHRDLYASHPELQTYNALERFKGMRENIGITEALDLTRAETLKNAIHEYDPAVDGPVDKDHLGRPEAETLSDLDNQASIQGIAQPLSPIESGGGKGFIQSSEKTFGLPMDDEGNVYGKSFRPSSPDLASTLQVNEKVEVGDVLVADPMNLGTFLRASRPYDPGVVGIVAGEPGVVLGAKIPTAETDTEEAELHDTGEPLQASVALSGIVLCKVDASYGSIAVGDVLTTSPTPGHAMRADSPQFGTILGKALEPLDGGTGLIKVLVMLR